ncbi:MAG: type VI secretion system tube protein Hcp [Sphingomonas sp.]|nr:type VI secretion system tube protein Hcp [Sphingomonas sp.]
MQDISAPSMTSGTPKGQASAATHDVVSPRDAASGMPTGKRQHGEVKINKTLDKSSPLLGRGASRPLLAKGGLTLAASLPGCAVGTRYPGGTLEGGGMRYELKDIQITSCAAGQLGLNYAKVHVRGWDPEKKED